MRRSEILGLRWRNVDLENNTFDVSEQLPFKVPPKTKVIEEMAPPKSNGRKLPITELARPFFLKQFAMQEAQREQAEKDGKPYYDNDLVVAKPDGAPIAASWVSSQFGKLLEDLELPHIRFHDLRYPNSNKIQTFQKNYRDCNKYHPKRFGFYFYHFFLTPQKATSEPSVFFHFTDTFLSFSSSSVASAFAFSSVVMSR